MVSFSLLGFFNRQPDVDKYNCKDYQGNYVQVNSSLLDESTQNLYNFNLNPLCLWVNRTGLVKADECSDEKYFFCEFERREYAKQKRFKDDKLSL